MFRHPWDGFLIFNGCFDADLIGSIKLLALKFYTDNGSVACCTRKQYGVTRHAYSPTNGKDLLAGECIVKRLSGLVRFFLTILLN